jgi:hypothetical protein
MIVARHAAWADFIFQPYLRWLFRRHFKALHLFGKPPQTEPHLPLLLLPNHSTWWDGFFVYFLNKKIFRRPAYLMMLEEQLARFHFFSRLGVFSVNPDSPYSVRESLTYAAGILGRQTLPRPLLCMFPQGELLPWNKRPLDYRRGVEVLMKTFAESVNVLSLAIRVEFLYEQKAEVFFLFGENQVVAAGAFPTVKTLQEIEEKLLTDLAAMMSRGEKGVEFAL